VLEFGQYYPKLKKRLLNPLSVEISCSQADPLTDRTIDTLTDMTTTYRGRPYPRKHHQQHST
jgi:hypothetical protein